MTGTKAALTALYTILSVLQSLYANAVRSEVGPQPDAAEEHVRTETKAAIADLEKLAPTLRERVEAERFDAILRTAAFFNETLGYGDVGKLLGVFSGSPKFTGMLAQRMKDDHASGEPLYCALICSKGGGNKPSQGFFYMAKSLGYTFADPAQFWQEQRDACAAASK